MTPFKKAVDKLIAATYEVERADQLKPFALEILRLKDKATSKEKEDACIILCREVGAEYLEISGWLLLVAGALVESGAPPERLSLSLSIGLPFILQRATDFVSLALTKALPENSVTEILNEEEYEVFGNYFIPQQDWLVLINENLNELDAWSGLSAWCQAAIAAFVADSKTRIQLKHLIPTLNLLAKFDDAAYSLNRLLNVLDDAHFLIIDIVNQKGFHTRVSGVVDNFQLHQILAAKITSQEKTLTADSFEGIWDLYQWTALDKNGRLPDKIPSKDWIWNEGIPADISLFEQKRVILLAPPSYKRRWKPAAYFKHLPAKLIIEKELSQAEILLMQEKMGTAQIDRSK